MHSKRLNRIQLAQMKVAKNEINEVKVGMDLECNEALILLNSLGYNSLAEFSLGVWLKSKIHQLNGKVQPSVDTNLN